MHFTYTEKVGDRDGDQLADFINRKNATHHVVFPLFGTAPSIPASLYPHEDGAETVVGLYSMERSVLLAYPGPTHKGYATVFRLALSAFHARGGPKPLTPAIAVILRNQGGALLLALPRDGEGLERRLENCLQEYLLELESGAPNPDTEKRLNRIALKYRVLAAVMKYSDFILELGSLRLPGISAPG